MRPNGSDLPHDLYGGGGVAKALRDERATIGSPSTSSLLYDGTDPPNDTYMAYSSPAWSSAPSPSTARPRPMDIQHHEPHTDTVLDPSQPNPSHTMVPALPPQEARFPCSTSPPESSTQRIHFQTQQ
jgi:hypothetical protein